MDDVGEDRRLLRSVSILGGYIIECAVGKVVSYAILRDLSIPRSSLRRSPPAQAVEHLKCVQRPPSFALAAKNASREYVKRLVFRRQCGGAKRPLSTLPLLSASSRVCGGRAGPSQVDLVLKREIAGLSDRRFSTTKSSAIAIDPLDNSTSVGHDRTQSSL